MAKRFQPPWIVLALAAAGAIGIACANSEPIGPWAGDPTSGAAGTYGIAGNTGAGVAGSSAGTSSTGTAGASGSIGATGSAGTKSSNVTSGQAGQGGDSGAAGTGGSGTSGVAGSAGGGSGSGNGGAGGGTGGAAGRGGSTGFAGRGGTGGSGGRGGTTGAGGRGGTSGTSGSPDGGTNPDGAAAPTFTDIYTSILVVYCAGSSCHSPGTQAGVSFASQSSAYSAVKTRVTPGNGAGSAFFNTVNSGSMPRGQAKLSAANLAKIKAWIDAGALNN